MAGPFKTTVRGNKYLQIIADSFSKYLVCRPTKNKASMTVATNLLEKWCWTFGIPEKFLSDKGKEFRSRVLEDLCSLLDIQRLNTTVGHPQCDGQSEKNVQQVKKMIRTHVSDDQENWDMGLPQLCFAYNSSIHETTGCSPFEVMFGREPIVPIDLIYPNRLEHTREKITESKRTQLSKINDVELDSTLINVSEQVDILIDADPIEDALALDVKKYVEEKAARLKAYYELLEKNRMLKMSRAKRDYDRKIKKN